MPFWIWVVLAGIVFSAIMTVRAVRAEDRQNEKYIEEEGQLYINRIEQAKQARGEWSN